MLSHKQGFGKRKSFIKGEKKKQKDGKNSAQSSTEIPGENSLLLHSEALLCSSAQESSLQLCQLWLYWQQKHRYSR